MSTLLIQNGTLVTALHTYKADILTAEGKVKEIAPHLPVVPPDRTIDAAGMLTLPRRRRCPHPHGHAFRRALLQAFDFETGTRAAAYGGTTTIVDFAIQAKGTKMRDALDIWWKKAEGKACIDYGLHMIVTDLGNSGLEDMDDLVREGVASFKLFMAYPNVLMVDDATIFRALGQTAKNGALICMHAENGGAIDVDLQKALAEGKTAPIQHALTRPVRAEAEAVNRAIALAEMAGTPVYIVHLVGRCAEPGPRSHGRGLPAFAETCRNTFCFSIRNKTMANFEGAKYVFTPPLREKHHLPKLWDGLKHDHLQVVSTDHCPFCFEDQKQLGKDDFTKIPNGGPGVENRLQLIWNYGVNEIKYSQNRFVELVFHNACENSSACTRAKARSNRAATPTSSSGTRTPSTPSAPPPITCASIIPCSKASKSKATPDKSSQEARS